MPANSLKFWQFDPSRFLLSDNIAMMTNAAVAGYWFICCKAMVQENPLSIPNDEAILTRWARLTPDEWAIAAPSILRCFHKNGDGSLCQPVIGEIYTKSMRQIEAKKEGGRRGGLSTQNKHSLSLAKPKVKAKLKHNAKQLINKLPKGNLAASPPPLGGGVEPPDTNALRRMSDKYLDQFKPKGTTHDGQHQPPTPEPTGTNAAPGETSAERSLG